MRVCLIGCGNIGKSLAVYIDENMFGTDLVGLFDKNREKSIRLKESQDCLGCIRRYTQG